VSRDWLLYLDDLIDSAEKILGHAKQLRERFDRGGEGSGIPA
jgi:hypothetical protein